MSPVTITGYVVKKQKDHQQKVKESNMEATLTVQPLPTVKEGKPLVFRVQKVTRKGPNEGVEYYEPVGATIQDYVNFWGEGTIKELLALIVRRGCRKWSEQAINDDGTFDLDDFTKMAQNFSARGESVSDIKERIYDLATNVLPAVFADGTLSMQEKITKAEEISAKINRLRADIAEKKRKTPADKAAEEEVEDKTPSVV